MAMKCITNTFYATVGAIVTVGAKALLVDCDDRYQIDITKIEKNIKKELKQLFQSIGVALHLI